MGNILQEFFKFGRGLTRISKEDLDKIFNELKKRGEAEEKDREPFISKTLEKLEKSGKDAIKKIKETVVETINPNLQRINEINKKVDEIIKGLNTLKKKEK